jgi:predicted MFS family arabinose efflux permease
VKISLKQGLRSCVTDRNFVRLLFVFGVLLGVMNTYGTVIGIITAEYGFNDSQASLFGAVFIVGGIIGSAVVGTLVELYKNYKTTTCWISFLTAVTPIGLLFAIRAVSVVWTAIFSFVVGSAAISIIPIGIDFGVELTHPVAESVSSGLLMSMG